MEGYYSVTEYSRITGKDPGNIRRMLIKGVLSGEKLGNQWVISKDVVIPEDGRLRSGDYRNWRKKNLLCRSNPRLMKSLTRMCAGLHDIFGETMYSAILYGSYARGEQSEESDVDIALILSEAPSEEDHERMVELVIDYELDLSVTLSLVPIELAQYLEWKRDLPFYKNIDREGILLWKTA